MHIQLLIGFIITLLQVKSLYLGPLSIKGVETGLTFAIYFDRMPEVVLSSHPRDCYISIPLAPRRYNIFMY